MAKKKKKDEPELSPEEQKEQEELKKRFEEKENKKKEQAKLLKKKEKTEIRRIKSKINFPYKLLLLVSLLFTLFAFIILFFGAEKNVLDSLYFTFMVFTAVYLGGGSIMLMLFYLVAEEKMAELESSKEAQERAREEEIQREEDEFAKLVQAEKDFATRKNELQEQKRIELERSEEEIMEHILEFQEEEEALRKAEAEKPALEQSKEDNIDVSKLPDINLDGLDLGFSDFNSRSLDDPPKPPTRTASKAEPKAPAVGEQEYSLDDLNFDFDGGPEKEAIQVDLK